VMVVPTATLTPVFGRYKPTILKLRYQK
jgi:hypothetical protein